MEESDPEYQAEMAKLKENARKEKLRQKALKDFKAQQREERVREGVEAVKTYRRVNHIPAWKWIPFALGTGCTLGAVWAAYNEGMDVRVEKIAIASGVSAFILFGWAEITDRAAKKQKTLSNPEVKRQVFDELEARGRADRNNAPQRKGDS